VGCGRRLMAVWKLTLLLTLGAGYLVAQTSSASGTIAATAGVKPNLTGHVSAPLRYHPEHGDFVITDGKEFFNRSLYGGNTAFRVDGGDRPEFVLYLPGRGGNLRLGVRTVSAAIWLKDAEHIVTRYRPGELIYEIQDPALGPGALLTVEVLAYADTEGLIVRALAQRMPPGAELVWVYGGVNGERGLRDGDIGTEKVPISQYFQFQPAFAEGNVFRLGAGTFTLASRHAAIFGVLPTGARQHIADAEHWQDLRALLSDTVTSTNHPVIVGYAPLIRNQRLFLSLQRLSDASPPPPELKTYLDVTSRDRGSVQTPARTALLPVFEAPQLPEQFASAEKQFESLRNRVRIETPDPYIDAAVGSLNVVADALWDADARAIMHGSIAWRTKLLGWRGPYALDALGWHDRARQNFETWIPRQNTDPVGPVPAPDSKANLARNEPGLHSNGDLSNSHYDMNMVFIDALFRHLLWTGDKDYAQKVWPVIQRHIAWERRLFRREYGAEKLPLYEAYATIWASDDLYYNGGGSAYASAYNVYANRMAARIATMIGEDPAPYSDEAARTEKAMRTLLWLPREKTFAESKDLLGNQLVHADYGLWNFYHTVDEEAATPPEAWQMGVALNAHFKPIPVEGPGVPSDASYHVFSETDWMPYSWSINNVVMDENMHTALALWQSGHTQDAYVLAKSSLLASMYMGISPGNLGTMNYLDVYRRESQRDFGDSAGAMSRAIVEGLFGIHPDALAGTMTISPGFPREWQHARLTHPDIGLTFRRKGRDETWSIVQNADRFHRLTLRIPAAFKNVAGVEINGIKAKWRADSTAVGRPILIVECEFGESTQIRITWSGDAFTANADQGALAGSAEGDFIPMTHGALSWLATPRRAPPAAAPLTEPFDWRAPRRAEAMEAVDLTGWLNDRVDAIFARGKYLSPRSSSVSLSLPSQGAGAWAGHLTSLPAIDDSGIRRVAAANQGKIEMPNGVQFTTPSEAARNNIAFTSQWDNYPRAITIPLAGHARRAYFLMAGSTNFMQSRMDNGEVIVNYTDGTSTRLPLRNPETWWPIEQDYFIDDYQFPFAGPLPPRIDLKTGRIRLLDLETFKGKGAEVPGGAATALTLGLDPSKVLQSLTIRALCNDVVIGLMSAVLER